MEFVEAVKFLAEQLTNKALTVKELWDVYESEYPVWLAGVGSKDQWVRIDFVEELTIGFSAFGDADTWSFCTERYGKTVFAYRYPPVKEEQTKYCFGWTDTKALTVEELRDMDGQPVWCESTQNTFPCKGWYLVDMRPEFASKPLVNSNHAIKVDELACGLWVAYCHQHGN